MSKAIIYARVSSTRQAEDEVSIPAQIQRCHDKAAQMGATVARVFSDEGLSGRSDNRPQFQAALDYVETVGADYLITWSTSRFARNKLDAALAKRRIESAGCDLVFISVPIDRGTDAGFLLESFLEVMDEYQSRQTAADTRRSMIRNAEQGFFCGGRPPFGYQPEPHPDHPRRRRLAVDDTEAPVVRRIFNLRLQDYGAFEIARSLNNSGLLNRGSRWNKSSILNVLRSHAVIGQAVFGRRVRIGGKQVPAPREKWIIVDSHEPIIDRVEWNEAQRLIDGAAPGGGGSPRSGWLFTGMLWDGINDCSMQVETARGNGGSYAYYNSRRAMRHGDVAHRRVRCDHLDTWLSEQIIAQVFTPDALRDVIRDLDESRATWDREIVQERRAISAQLGDLRQRQSRLYDILEMHGKDAPDLGDLTDRLRANKSRIQALDERLAHLENTSRPEINIDETDLHDLAETLRAIVATTEDPEKTRAFFASFVERVTLLDDRVEINYYPECLLKPSVVHSKEGWLPERALLRTVVVPLGVAVGGRALPY